MGRPPKRWLITDTHFNCRFYEAIGRPSNHSDLVLGACRRLVAAQDVLIHLGDVIDERLGELTDLLAAVPCRSKILVRGNHDTKSDAWYLDHGFDFVCDALRLGDVLLSHMPVPLADDIRLNVHGHWHNFPDERIQQYEPALWAIHDPKRHRRLALEYTNYQPVEFTAFTME